MQPATKLHTLHIKHISIGGLVFGMKEQWLNYISQKYTQMINFSIGGLVGMGSSHHETVLKRVARGCPKIKNYKIKIFPLTSGISEAIDTSGIQLKELEILS